MNVTFKVLTHFDCDVIEDYKHTNSQDPLWTQTVLGCRLLLVLKDMYRFKVTYMNPNIHYISGNQRSLSAYPQVKDSVDIYAKPMGFTHQMLEISYPTEAIFTGRYGFILRRPNSNVLLKFYSLPFTLPVWKCLCLAIPVVSGIFFYLSRWEKKILGGYSCYHYELLLAVGACCQNILPFQANMTSRRIAYLSFMLGVYVLNCFYCSNLLSHIVSDKDNSMDLQTLANSDYECVKLEVDNEATQHSNMTHNVQSATNTSVIQYMLSRAKYMNMIDGLNAVMTSRTALLTNYFIVYPVLIKMFETDDICQLIQIDLHSDIKKYFYTSKNFSYKEEFKIGILKAKETGVLRRILLTDVLPSLNCAYTYPTRAEFQQIIIPLIILLGSYAVATLIMLLERWHHREYKVWPYVN